jgi:two-component system response regulator DctR
MDGKGSKEIATEMGITFFTVNTHRRNLLERTGSKNTAELVNRGMAHGWF